MGLAGRRISRRRIGTFTGPPWTRRWAGRQVWVNWLLFVGLNAHESITYILQIVWLLLVGLKPMAHDSNTYILQFFRWLLVGLKPMAHDLVNGLGRRPWAAWPISNDGRPLEEDHGAARWAKNLGFALLHFRWSLTRLSFQLSFEATAKKQKMQVSKRNLLLLCIVGLQAS